MNHLDFYGLFRVEIRGEGDVADKLRKTYEHFLVPDDGTSPDLLVEVTRDRPDPDAVLGGSSAYYGRDGDRFVIQEGNVNYMVIDRDWKRIRTSPANVHHHVAYLIEFEVRKQLTKQGKALVHASGVRWRDVTMLFPAWRHSGKTNTMLTLLDDGADYLSDDRVWVDTEGAVDGYPLPVNVMSWNDDMFGFDPDLTRLQRLRKNTSEFILDRLDMRRSIIDKLAYVFTNQFIGLDVRYRLLGVEELISSTTYVPSSTVDYMVFLRASLDAPDNEVVVEEISGADALSDLRMISYWEWNRRMRDYFGAFDMLFPSPDRLGELAAIESEEERIFGELVEEVPVFRAHIPREKDWIGTGISDQILAKLPP